MKVLCVLKNWQRLKFPQKVAFYIIATLVFTSNSYFYKNCGGWWLIIVCLRELHKKHKMSPLLALQKNDCSFLFRIVHQKRCSTNIQVRLFLMILNTVLKNWYFQYVLKLIFLFKIPQGTTAAIAALTTPSASKDSKYCGRALSIAVGTAHASVCSK